MAPWLFWCWLGSLISFAFGQLQAALRTLLFLPISSLVSLWVSGDQLAVGWSPAVFEVGVIVGDSGLLQCLILLQSQLGVFLANAGEQEGHMPPCACDFHASADIVFANVSVAQVSHMAESRLKGG